MSDEKTPQNPDEITPAGTVELEEQQLDAASGGLIGLLNVQNKYNEASWKLDTVQSKYLDGGLAKP